MPGGFQHRLSEQPVEQHRQDDPNGVCGNDRRNDEGEMKQLPPRVAMHHHHRDTGDEEKGIQLTDSAAGVGNGDVESGNSKRTAHVCDFDTAKTQSGGGEFRRTQAQRITRQQHELLVVRHENAAPQRRRQTGERDDRTAEMKHETADQKRESRRGTDSAELIPRKSSLTVSRESTLTSTSIPQAIRIPAGPGTFL